MALIMSTKTVASVMRQIGSFPLLKENDSLKYALDLMTKHRLGIACIVNKKNELVAVLSDGDLRRLLLSHQSPLPALLVSDAIRFARRDPVVIPTSSDLMTAKNLMRNREIWDLPVVDPTIGLVGLLHGHDIN